jgi:hypothetical protein
LRVLEYEQGAVNFDMRVPVGGILGAEPKHPSSHLDRARNQHPEFAQQRAALVHESNSRQIASANASIHIRTAYEAGIPSSVIRLSMLQASRASTDCPSASRACSRSQRILL